METELRRGYSGTAKRKGRQQTNRTYCHRATFLLYRFSTPEDIGNAACYLCSDEASMVTGVCMEVDGGRCI